MKHKRIKLVLIAITTFCVIVGTLAYWTQEIYVNNEFKTPIYMSQIKEEFSSPSNWTPGHEVNKDVWIENDSDIPVLAKASIQQSWVRSETVYDINGEPIEPLEGENLDLYFDTGNGIEPASLIKWGENVVVLGDVKQTTRKILDKNRSSIYELPVVYNLNDAKNKWVILNEEPDDKGYINIIYLGEIDKNSLSTKLIDAVVLNPNVQQTITNKETTYDEATGKWVSRWTSSSNGAYDCSQYTLTVNAETVQATNIAALEIFGEEYREFIDFITKEGKADEVESKYLVFDEKHGKMTWNLKDSKNNNWFMSFTKMVPGEKYADRLVIENKSDRKFELFMQFVPQSQSAKKDELLSFINMKVFLDNKVMYEGTVEGNSGEENDPNLRNIIKLCDLHNGGLSEVDIILELDKSVTVDYADILTEIDCKFMVKEKNSSSLEYVESEPETGDKIPIIVVIAAMLIVVISNVGFIVLKYRNRR